jgi:transposase InsO family protein
VHHINAVDEVTQFEVVCCVERISERYLIPVLEQLLDSFPFTIRGFHSDNGSEYINRQVARLLEKLRIEFTKSRPRRSNDNALTESKNGAVVRKLFGYEHIPQHWAPVINAFNQEYLNPYINYHRPCFFPETLIDDKGRQCKIYRYDNMMTPYDKFKSLPDAADYLKPGMTFETLDKVALNISDNEAAARMMQARRKLFNDIHEQIRKTG